MSCTFLAIMHGSRGVLEFRELATGFDDAVPRTKEVGI